MALGELWRYRSVGTALARRNLKARYRQTVLGVVWVLIQPLALGLIMAFFFNLISRQGYYDIPFPAWFITGLAIWGPVTKIMNEGAVSLVANQNLVTRVYLPRPLIPISVALDDPRRPGLYDGRGVRGRSSCSASGPRPCTCCCRSTSRSPTP